MTAQEAATLLARHGVTPEDAGTLAQMAGGRVAYDIERIVLAHDQVIEGDARKRLEGAFAWLGDKIGA